MSIRHAKGSTAKAKEVSVNWIIENNLKSIVETGLPEYDDRFNLWRIPIHTKSNGYSYLGEVKVDLELKNIVSNTDIDLIKNRAKKSKEEKSESKKSIKEFRPNPVRNSVILGNCNKILDSFPNDTAQLVFTSPPYYNAKPEYAEYVDYDGYLKFIKNTFQKCHDVLSEGRFIVVNISPVLIRRTSRKTASKRIPLQFDYHRLLDEVGFEFIDDIIWQKPEGAGWNVGRGRRFRADRNPLQYKPVPVTEYVLVYRKKTTKLIDWNLRKHWDKQLIKDSKIEGEYDVTNIWKLHPGHSKVHPAIFPVELAEKVIRYYSFKGDLVLDPFAGTGTTSIAALNLNRRFLMIENDLEYFNHMNKRIKKHSDKAYFIDIDPEYDFKNGF